MWSPRPTVPLVNFSFSNPTSLPPHEQNNLDIMSSQPSSSSSGTSRFTFVSGNEQSEARSHAMKEHWKRRHQRNHEAKAHHRKRSSRTLLPRSKSGLGEGAFSAAYPNSSSESELQREENINANHQKQPSVPAQLLNGMSFALSTSRPDPFQTCPVHLTSQHQKLLYHCPSTSIHYCWYFAN